jgi:hypothetical protein
VRAGDEQVTVMVAHLKSKLISYARQPGVVGGSMFAPNDEGERLRYAGYALYRRTAEAMACRAALDTVFAAAGDQLGEGAGTGQANPVIFCGDLNDEPPAATTQIIQGPGGSEIDFRAGQVSEPAIAATATGCGTSTGCCRPTVPTTVASTEGGANSSTTYSPPTGS